MSSSAPALGPSVATQVFRVAELVGLFLEYFEKAELPTLATISSATRGEVQRRLYPWPRLDKILHDDPRLVSLVLGLEAAPWDAMRGFTFSFKGSKFPDQTILTRLVSCCPAVCEVHIFGIPPVGIPRSCSALRPIAAQLRRFDLSFRSKAAAKTLEVLRLISACTQLEDLEIGGLDLTGNLFQLCPPPAYHLISLALYTPATSIDQDALRWLLHSSSRTLKDFGHSPLPSDALLELGRLAPALEEAHFTFDPEDQDQMDAAVAMATLPNLNVLDIEIGPWLDQAERWEVMQCATRAVARLNANDRAKVTIM